MTLFNKNDRETATGWVVITGAPCSGKTTVVEALARMGFKTVRETARAYIDSQRKKGLTLSQIKADPHFFERTIMMEKAGIEAALPTNETIIMDRAVPDSIAYYRFEGLNPEEPLARSRVFRYKHIFLFDRLRFEKDAVRSETSNDAARIERLIHGCYEQLGYTVVRIPVMSVMDRVKAILTHL